LIIVLAGRQSEKHLQQKKKAKTKTTTTTTKKQSKLCAFLFAVCVNFVLLYVFLISQFS